MKYIKTFENIDNEEFFFSQDCSSHWHMIPFRLKDRWNELNRRCENENDYDAFNLMEAEFGSFRTGGGIENIVFKNPRKI